jgi:hypothetical protein
LEGEVDDGCHATTGSRNRSREEIVCGLDAEFVDGMGEMYV